MELFIDYPKKKAFELFVSLKLDFADINFGLWNVSHISPHGQRIFCVQLCNVILILLLIHRSYFFCLLLFVSFCYCGEGMSCASDTPRSNQQVV